MLKARILFFFLITAIVLSCSDDDSVPTVQNELLDLTQIKAALNGATSDNLFIVEIGEQTINGLPYTVVHFESGDSIFFKSSFITGTTQEASKWNLKFDFSDNSVLNASLVGDSLYVEEIDVNPHTFSPLSALASIKMPVEGKFKVEVLGQGDDGITISHTFESFSADHELPILGLYQNSENQVRLSFLSTSNIVRLSKTYTVTTEELDYQPTIEIIQNNLNGDEQNIYFVSNLSMGFDQTGEIRWAFTGDAAHLYRKLSNGNLIIASGDNMIVYHSDSFYEVSMLGEIVKEYEIPNHLHHEIRELPNGNFLVGANSYPFVMRDGFPEEDMIVEIDKSTGSVLKSWDLNVILDSARTTLPVARPDDWFHLNAAYYDETDQSIVVSGRSQSCVAKIDYNTSEVKWILSNPNFWKTELVDKVLTPVDDSNAEIDASQIDFWPAGQHAPLRLPNGNLLVFDNGIYRNFYYDQNVEQNSYTRVVEFEIDETNRRIKMVSEFKYKDINTISTGDIDYISETEGYLVGFMNRTSNSTIANTPKIVELSSTKEVLFEADIDVNTAPSNYYRAERMYLYDNIDQ